MNFYNRLLHQVTQVTRVAIGNMIRPVTVGKQFGDKILPVIGHDPEGKPVYGPWTHVATHRAGNEDGPRERRWFRESPDQSTGEGGQNGFLLSPTGDPRQAVFIPGPPSKNCMPPDHAASWGSGQSSGGSQGSQGSQGQQEKKPKPEETYQFGDLRLKTYFDPKGTEMGWDVWLQKPKKKNQQQGDLEKLPEHESDASGQADMKLRINKSGGVTGRIGKDVRFAAHAKGAKIKHKKNFVTTTEDKIIMKSSKDLFIHADKTIWFNKPPKLKPAPDDPVPDDDK